METGTRGSNPIDLCQCTCGEPSRTVARQINRLLVDQHGVDNAAHLDQLLPIAAVAGKARDLAGGNRAHFAEADLCHHPLEAGAHHTAGGRATEIVVDDLDLRPAESHQALAHRVLQRPALAVVQDLMARRLTHVEDRSAIQMMLPILSDIIGRLGSERTLFDVAVVEQEPGY